MVDSKFLVTPGKKLKLSDFPPDKTPPFRDKSEAIELTAKNVKRLGELQAILYAARSHAVLIVLQAMDTGGKDGTIAHVFDAVNPQGCRIESFKVPSSEEASHDYLWRFHHHTPERGMITIFNRSHYESVLVERVRGFAAESRWRKRYGHINNFEQMLADEGTVIVKFFLNISKDEQKARLQSRLDDKDKSWKFSAADVAERKLWDDYMRAYSDALEKCSTQDAPWYVVPANKKWFRNWVVSDILVRTLENLSLSYPKPQAGIEKIKID